MVARYFRRQYNIQTEFNKSGELIIFEATTGTGNLCKSMQLTDPELLQTVLHHSKQVVMNDHARCMTFHVTSFSMYLTYNYEICISLIFILCYTNQEKKPNIYVWSIHCDKKYLHLDQISKQNTSWFEHPLEPEDQMRVVFFLLQLYSNYVALSHTSRICAMNKNGATNIILVQNYAIY